MLVKWGRRDEYTRGSLFILPQEKEVTMDTVCKFRVAASHQLTTPTKHLVIIKFHQLLFSYKEQDILITWALVLRPVQMTNHVFH